MSSHQASVNGCNQALASATPSAVSKPSKKPRKPFVREQETDAGWCLRQDAEKQHLAVQRAAKKAAARDKARTRAIKIAPAVAQRVAEARARLVAQHAASAATNPKFTATIATYIGFQASAGIADAKLVYAADCQPVFSDRRKARQALVAADVKLRLDRGFEWRGGAVAGNGDYIRAPFRYEGLLSDEHPILHHFVSKLPRARRLRVADDKAETYGLESKVLGLDSAYVEGNKSMVGILRIELDTDIGLPEIREACDRLEVPRPNIVVGWQDSEGRYRHPHLLWLLHDSVPVVGPLCGRFLALYRGVCRGMTKALLSIGADVGGLSNLHRHKNPLSPLWDRAVLVEQPYDLGDLKLSVDITVRMKVLHALSEEMRGEAVPAPVADHPVPEVAAQSNKLFAHLTGWARTQVVALRAAGGERAEFDILVADEAYRFGAALAGDAARSEAVALRTARTVSEWTWNVYRAPERKRAPMSGKALADAKAQGGRVVAERRRARSEDVIVAAAVRLAETGEVPTQAEVLAAVAEAGIRGEKTIRRHWPAVLEAVACQQARAC